MSSSPCLLISDLDINIEYKSADEVFCLISNSRFVSERVQNTLKNEEIDGISLLSLNGNDIDSLAEKHGWLLGEKKRFMIFLGLASRVGCNSKIYRNHQGQSISSNTHRNFDSDIAPPEGGNRLKFRPNSLKPDFFKTAVSLGYAFLVTWLTALVMVIVHERVPDSKRYPPLPDIFLDNVPRIKWAFTCCEVTGTILFCIWITLLVFHKYRLILLRRFFALGGTVFLLRCFTMLITSLSVPGTHLECAATDYKIDEDDDGDKSAFSMLSKRFQRAYVIWSGLGMSIQGVRTCGDYMFSGHTVALTLLNFFITEYTPRTFYFLHTSTWLLNMFGIFFILAAHEHYSIDVFIAFYIASRLFLYYHTLANNQALMSQDSNRTKIWFPLFSYFESSVDGIVPNEYNSVIEILKKITDWIIVLKDLIMLNARRFWDPLRKKEEESENNEYFFNTKSHTNRYGIEPHQKNHNTARSKVCKRENSKLSPPLGRKNQKNH